MRKYIFLIFLLFTVNLFYGQESLYLIGNLKGPKLSKKLKHFQKSIEKENHKNGYTLVLLGDIRQKNQENEDSLIAFINRIQHNGAKVIAVSGDRDWDKSRLYGLDSVSAMQNRFSNKIGNNIFMPKKICPGPRVKDIGENIRIIGINSQWWLHPYRKTLPIDSECKYISKIQILDELNEAIETAGNRRVIIVTHHPIISGGVYGGNSNIMGHLFPFAHDKPNNRTLAPIFGTLYNKYRQNIGTEQDFSSHEYKSYIADLEKVLSNHHDIIVCSSHEYDLEVLKFNNNYQIISGSFLKSTQVSKTINTLYKNKSSGFIRLDISANKELIGKVFLYDKKLNDFLLADSIPIQTDSSFFSAELSIKSDPTETNKDNKYIGGNYKASKFKKLFFGSLYRKAWTTPVEIPTLDLDTIYGGITPSTKGGGLQTISLKFKDKDGRKYAFRSINKTPIKALPKELRISLVNDITQDMTATQHPYGALFVASLLNSTELYHGTPKLYIMPDSPKLGKYRNQFAGMFGMLESKPTELDDLNKSYVHANQVKGTLSLFKKLYNSTSSYIDTSLYAKARVFDILIGDWDRHQDNWKWIGFKKDSTYTMYKPYPKDRDHSFSKMDGLFYYLANREWGIAFRENFKANITGIKSLTLKASHLDRMLLSGLSKEDWLSVTDDLNTQITDSVIDLAKTSFPVEIQNGSGTVIAIKLKQRKKELNRAIEEYYLLLSKEVDVIGTNQEELFVVNRLNSGSVNVKMYKKIDTAHVLFDRTFFPHETDEIRLFGLSGVDSFYLHGSSYKSIMVRIIGGNDKDVVVDNSYAQIGAKKTLVYDYHNGVELNKGRESRVIITDETFLNEYNHESHKYSTYLPTPLLVSNPDDGFGFGFLLNAKTFGFGYEDYKVAYTIKAFATTKGSSLYSAAMRRNIARTKFYITTKLDYGNFFPFYSFYGVGNNTSLIDSIEDAGLYKARYTGLKINSGISYRFLERSSVSLNGIGEILEEGHTDQSFFDYFPSPQLMPKNAGGAELKIDIDFRDSKTFTTRGIRFIISNQSLMNNDKIFGKNNAEISYYGTPRVGIPVTLGVKLGTERTFGDNIPYYHLASMGQSRHLRGFLQNRFSGFGLNYINTDLRFHLGKLKSGFLPMYYGINLFGDFGQIIENDDLIGKKWHNGYGGGIYLTPINKEYFTLKVNIERSIEAQFIKISLGVLL